MPICCAVRTPEVFVLDSDRIVRYWGRIDHQFGVGFQKPKANHNDLEAVLGELLAGKTVSQPTTEAIGCLIGRVKRPDPSGTRPTQARWPASCKAVASNAIMKGKSLHSL